MRALPVVLMLLPLSASACDRAPRHQSGDSSGPPIAALPLPSDDAAALKEIDAVGSTAQGKPESIRTLARWVRDPRRVIADRAAEWLGKAGPGGVNALARALDDSVVQTRVVAAYGLGSSGANARGALPVLTRHLAGSSDSVANMCDWAISQIQPDGSPSLRLLRGLRYGNSFERAEAARKLSIYGEGVADALQLLIRALDDKDPLVVHAAEDAIAARGATAVPAVRLLLKSDDPNLRYRGLLLLNRLQPAPF